MQCTTEDLVEIAERFGTTASSGGMSGETDKTYADRLGLNTHGFAAFKASMSILMLYLQASPGDQDAVDLERDAVHTAMRIIRPGLEAKLQARLTRLDEDLEGVGDCLACSGVSESQGKRRRTWTSLVGDLDLGRRYRHCDICRGGWAPAQVALGLPNGPFTARMEEVCTLLATTVSHEMACDLLEKITGIRVSPAGLEHMVKRRAEGLEDMLNLDARRYRLFDDIGLPVSEHLHPDDVVDKVPEVAYLEMDGVFPMVREPVPAAELSAADRRRLSEAKLERARGGKGRTWSVSGREVKNAVLYRGDDCVQESPGRGSLLDKRYVTHLGTWRDFADLLSVELLRLRFDEAKRLVVLSDGAEWIRTLCREYLAAFPVFLILDLFHVKHRIWDVANALYGRETPEAKAWAHQQCDRAEDGRAEQVVQALRFIHPTAGSAAKLVEDLREYIENNIDRMDYPTYRKQGLRVGSGAVESANFHMTGARLKLQGMRWSEQGARHMAYLRADLFNGNWERTTKDLLRIA